MVSVMRWTTHQRVMMTLEPAAKSPLKSTISTDERLKCPRGVLVLMKTAWRQGWTGEAKLDFMS